MLIETRYPTTKLQQREKVAEWSCIFPFQLSTPFERFGVPPVQFLFWTSCVTQDLLILAT